MNSTNPILQKIKQNKMQYKLHDKYHKEGTSCLNMCSQCRFSMQVATARSWNVNWDLIATNGPEITKCLMLPVI